MLIARNHQHSAQSEELAEAIAEEDDAELEPDALLWIGTRRSLQALLDARARAKAGGAYADADLSRGGYDFLANDSSAVISRTGKWLTEWIRELPAR